MENRTQLLFVVILYMVFACKVIKDTHRLVPDSKTENQSLSPGTAKITGDLERSSDFRDGILSAVRITHVHGYGSATPLLAKGEIYDIYSGPAILDFYRSNGRDLKEILFSRNEVTITISRPSINDSFWKAIAFHF